MKDSEIKLKIVELYFETFKSTGVIPDHKRIVDDLESLWKFVYGDKNS